jgi:hypothetical protein
MGRKITNTLARHRYTSSWFTYQAFGFPLNATISETQILAFQFICEFTFSLPHCKNTTKATHELNRAQHIVPCIAHNSQRTPGTRLCEHEFRTIWCDCENKFWSWNIA